MKKNMVEKIWDRHVVSQTPGHPAVLEIDKMLLHEVTSAQAFDELRRRKLTVKHPERMIATVDHSIPTDQNRSFIRGEIARKQVDTLRKNAPEFGITLYDFDSQYQGVVHVIGPELGFTTPGATIVCGDSHTSTHGAFGALAFGIGTSEVGYVLATSCVLQHKPKTMKVSFIGQPASGVFSKDIIMKLIATIGIGGAQGYVIEYTGDIIQSLSMEARMTLCNMSIECGARAGLIAPDETTFQYLKGRRYAPGESDWAAAVEQWRSFGSDPGCQYDRVIEIDIEGLKPMVTWGINPQQAIEIDQSVPSINEIAEAQKKMAEQAYQYTGLNPGDAMIGQKIDWAFVGSCTNGRIEDLREVAAALKNKTIANHVTFYVVPGSEQVLQQAVEEGLPAIFEKAGAQFRMPGCSMCLGMNDDKVPPGARCISTSNRNFMGRQGPGSITHLASPRTVATSAIAGVIHYESL